MLNELFVQFFTFGSFVAFSVAAKLTNYDTSYWSQKLSHGSLGPSIWIMGPPGSDQMRKARYFEYAKVCSTSVISMGVTHTTLSHLVEDAERPRSGSSICGVSPDDTQIFCDLGIYLCSPAAGRCEGRAQGMLDNSRFEYRDLDTMANS